MGTARRKPAASQPEASGVADAAAPEPCAGAPVPFDPDEPYCFVISSFADTPELRAVRHEAIAPAARRFGFRSYRMDELPSGGQMIDEIRDAIRGADFVIADLTHARPNCYYELGFAHAIGRPVVHVVRAGDDVHFDVQGFRVLRYASAAELRTHLECFILLDALTVTGRTCVEDRNRGQFGRRAFVHPYLLSARVEPLPPPDPARGREVGSQHWFRVHACVRTVDPDRPLPSAIRFCHDPETLSRADGPPSATTRTTARCEVLVYGAYALGAVVGEGAAAVRLELDLARVPGANDTFRAR